MFNILYLLAYATLFYKKRTSLFSHAIFVRSFYIDIVNSIANLVLLEGLNKYAINIFLYFMLSKFSPLEFMLKLSYLKMV